VSHHFLQLESLVVILNIIVVISGALLFIFRLGGKMDRLSGAIEHLTRVLEDHEERIRVLEHESPVGHKEK